MHGDVSGRLSSLLPFSFLLSPRSEDPVGENLETARGSLTNHFSGVLDENYIPRYARGEIA